MTPNLRDAAASLSPEKVGEALVRTTKLRKPKRRPEPVPASCRKCGAVVALRCDKNGQWQKFDLDFDLNVTDQPHLCYRRAPKK